MKKLLFTIFVLFIAVSLTTQAQVDKGKFAIGVGGEVAIPSGDAADAADLGVGFTWDWSAITVLGGAKYYFNKGFYALAQLGIHSFSFDAEVSGSGSSFFSGGSTSDSEFGFGAGLGYELPIGKTMLLDLNAKYMFAASDFNYIGVRAGLKFPLK